MEFRQVVKNHCDISPVTNFLNVNHAKAANEGKPLVVLIAPQEKDRSKAQNRLYWIGLINGLKVKVKIKITSICSLRKIS